MRMSEKSALEELREDVSARARAYLDRARELIDFPGDAESLGEFLDPADPTRTVEGYPAPKRVYLKLSV